MSRASTWLACSFVATALVACGGAAESSAPKSPSSVEGPAGAAEPQTVEEAQAELERARAALGAPGTGASGLAGAAAPSASPPSSSTTAPAPVAPQMVPQGGGAQAATTCSEVCRAVTSMHHAKDAICRLAGPTDPRCADAKKKVADGDAQAVSCSCPVK